MSVEKISLDGVWKLRDVSHPADFLPKFIDSAYQSTDWMEAQVPGDVHPPLIESGRIPDPFLGLNTEKCEWTAHADWWHVKETQVPASFEGKDIFVIFDGIDTFSTIYVNGKKVGETANMFLRYEFNISEHVKVGEKNIIAVCIHGTKEIIEARDTSKYMACFYVPRVFARKAQCQFEWDWAPHLPALGIWESVSLEARDVGIIEDVYIRTKSNGEVHVEATLDFALAKQVNAGERTSQIEVKLSGHGSNVVDVAKVVGKNNFINMKIDNPKLWMPNGYGEPNLYEYEVTLKNDDAVLDVKSGRFGVREVELVEESQGKQMHSFTFKINSVEVFALGANWVPADCFTGTVKKETYENLIRLTKEANFNMIRVWGGGIYEKNEFYDLCDENGIMIWQDMMFACSDIPDDDLEWTRSLIPEFEYQVRRLRNHPCITHWCGGNEKTGSFAELVTTGDVLTNYITRGVVGHLMPDLAYTPSSPYSLTDVSNDAESGDTHGGMYEQAFEDDIRKFRAYIDEKHAVFMSEFGLHGPPQYKSLVKFMSPDKLWPLNEEWEHHVQDNPYNSIPETFVQVQHKCATTLFHAPDSAQEFVKVGGTFYAEHEYAEFQHHRRRQPENSGTMIWMLNDCWPCASWSVIDYYGLPKQSYYALKRACEDVVVSVREMQGKFEFYVTHSLQQKLNGKLVVALCDVDGEKKEIASTDVAIDAHTSKVALTMNQNEVPEMANSYLLVTFDYGQGDASEKFFHKLWKDINWPEPNLNVAITNLEEVDGEYEATFEFCTEKYARCVNLTLKEDHLAYFSDNYFDLISGESKTVTVRSVKAFSPSDVKINHWLTSWK